MKKSLIPKKLIRCNCCGYAFHLPLIENATSHDLSKIKRFLGTFMNRGLTPEELKHIIILKGGDDPDNQIILGCLVALPISEKTMYLSRMKIGKPFRKNKLASELLAHALHDAKDRKFSFAFAVTLSEKAARLLQKFNAEEINRYDFFKEIPQSIAQRNCPCSENHRYWRIRI